MRTLIRIGACASILVASAAPARAQILERLKKKASQAVEKKAEDKLSAKLDQMAQKLVDNSFSALFGDSTSAGGGGGRSGSGGGLPFTIGTNAKTEDRYTFNVVTTTEIESFRRGGTSEGKAILLTHFNTSEPYTGTSIVSTDGKKPEGTAFIVFDAKNTAMVMLMASEKSKFSIAYDWKDALKYAQESANAQREQVNWDTVRVWRNYTKIGTRTIAGYAADGYRTEAPEATVEIWVTRDRAFGVGNMFAANSSMKQMRGRLPADYPVGMVLEMTSVNRNSGEKVTMKVTDINTNARVTYVMADYPRMEVAKK